MKKIIECEYTVLPDSGMKTIRYFNEQRNVVRAEYYHGTFFSAYEEISFDERGRKKTMNRHDYFLNEDEKNEYSLDTVKKELTRYYYMSNGKLNSKWIFTYDARGNITSYTVKEPNGVSRGTIEYRYDERGNKIAKIDAYSKCTYTYDKTGNLLESSLEGMGKVTFSFSKFDKAGNWQLKDEFDGNVHVKTTRQITYL